MNASVALGRPSLFQDVKTVTYLKQKVLPVLLARVQDQPRELRLWLVGCGSGEDPYTLAMLLTDLLGSHPMARAINVFATDEDETGLALARRGLYSAHQVGRRSPKLPRSLFCAPGQTVCDHSGAALPGDFWTP